MLRRKKTKIAALLISIAIIILTFTDIKPGDVGLYCGCPLQNRLLYHFFHANVIHLSLNVWCLLSCVFLADVSAPALLFAYAIACTVPVSSGTPTVGLSGVCFALLGFIMWNVKKKLSYNFSIFLCIATPLVLLPHAVNNMLHAYCYAVAVIAGAVLKLCNSKK